MTLKLNSSKTWENATAQNTKKQLLAYLDTRKRIVSLHHKIYLNYLIAFFCPILTFGAEVWGYQYINKLEKGQSKFVKQYLYQSQNAADFYALGEWGRHPLCMVYFVKYIKYLLKLIALDAARYPKQCYMMLYRPGAASRNTWASHVRKLIFNYGFGYAWIWQEIGNPETFIRLFTEMV